MIKINIAPTSSTTLTLIGVPYYNFGICTERRGEYANMGLMNFKESLGGLCCSRWIFEAQKKKETEKLENSIEQNTKVTTNAEVETSVQCSLNQKPRKKLAFFVSGGGSVAEFAFLYVQKHLSHLAQVVLVVSSSDDNGGIAKFRKRQEQLAAEGGDDAAFQIHVPDIKVVSWKKNREEICNQIDDLCTSLGVDYIFLYFDKVSIYYCGIIMTVRFTWRFLCLDCVVLTF